MAKHVLLNSRLFVGASDLTGFSNKIELQAEVEEKDSTAFGNNGWSEVLGGLANATVAGSGQWEANGVGSVDVELWSGLGNLGPWSMVPADNKTAAQSAAHGDLVYFLNALKGSIKFFDAVGEVAPWEGNAASTWPLVRGQVAHAPGVPITSTGAANGIELGAVAAGRYLFAAVHVLSVAGTSDPTITLSIESDTSDAFGSPTTRISFDAATIPQGQIARAGGPITDEWYRLAYTVSGSDPSFLVFSAIGIA